MHLLETREEGEKTREILLTHKKVPEFQNLHGIIVYPLLLLLVVRAVTLIGPLWALERSDFAVRRLPLIFVWK